MKRHLIWLAACVMLFTGCHTSGTLAVNSVSYQSLRTDFAQPESIPKEAKIAVEFFFNSKGEMIPIVYNLTSEILTIDQTKSFVIKPDGSSVSYFDPTVHTTTTGSYSSESSGTTFNLGGLANALGIGGVWGALANATTLGSSHTDGITRQNTVSIADQPLVHIGPKGCVAMSKTFSIKGVGFSGARLRNNEKIIDVSPSASNVRFSFCVSYSFGGEVYDKLTTNFYLSSEIAVPVVNRKVSDAFYKIYQLKPDALAENMYMFLIPNNIKAQTEDMMGEFLTHSNVYDCFIRGALIDFQ